MKTTRNVVGLTGLLIVLAVTAIPASANFQANQPNTTQGPALQVGTNVTITLAPTTVQVCTTLENGEWHIQTKFSKVGGSPVEVKQDLTKDGPHEAFTGQYKGCTATGGVSATVNPKCALQAQQVSSTSGLDAVISECEINIAAAACVVKIPAGNSNVGLEKITYGNVTGAVEVKSEVKGITEVATGIGCAIAGIKSGKEGEFKATVQASSQKVE